MGNSGIRVKQARKPSAPRVDRVETRSDHARLAARTFVATSPSDAVGTTDELSNNLVVVDQVGKPLRRYRHSDYLPNVARKLEPDHDAAGTLPRDGTRRTGLFCAATGFLKPSDIDG